MIAQPEVGDYVTNMCPRCQRTVRSQVELRSVQLARTRLVVRDVPVDVCPNCDHMISIAPHAVEQLREAGWAK
jgi:YgiT-type zinc finger domain-containing protein